MIKDPQFKPKAKHVIFLFMNGGLVAGRQLRSEADAGKI